MTAELEPRSQQAEIAAMEYEGPDSLAGASLLRNRMAAGAELAKRAGLDAREYLWTAREAERALGRMILAAREAGDLAKQGDNQHAEDMQSLHDLGIEPHLAAHAVQLAAVPEDEWRAWHEGDAEATRAAVGGQARRYLSAVDDLKRRAETAAAQAEQASRDAEIARRRLQDAEAARPDIPPLSDAETSLAGADLALQAAAASSGPPPLDNSPEARQQESIVAAMAALARRLEAHDPHVLTGAWRDTGVMAARDAARHLTDATAVWLRTLNALYSEGLREGKPE